MTQVGAEYKSFGGRPDFFFSLKERDGGLTPMGLVDYNTSEKKEERAKVFKGVSISIV